MRRRILRRLTRRVLAVLAASASAAALLAAAPPGPVFADHVDTDSRPGYTWTVGTSSHTTWKNGYHTNNWVCRPNQPQGSCQDSRIAPDAGQGLLDITQGAIAWDGQTGKSSCPLNRPPVDDDAGCGHTNNGNWVYTGHSSLPNPGTPDIYRCNLPGHPDNHPNHGSYVDDLHTECSMWVALPECSDGQHRHGSDDCHADHTPPDCIAGLASDQTQEWTPTPNHGHTAVGLARIVARIRGAGGVGGRFGGCRAARGSDVSALGLVVACGARVDRFGGAAGRPVAGFGMKAGWLGGWVLPEPGGEVAAGASLPVGEGGDEGVDLVADEVELEAVGADGVGAAVAEAFFEVVVG